MRKLAAAAAVLAAVGAAFLAGAWTEHRASKRATDGGREVLYWVDPMHPAYRSDAPGVAPDCGMQLEPVYADGAAPSAQAAPRPAGAVEVAAAERQLLGVRLAEVERAPAQHVVRLFGRVVAEETRVHVLNAATEGSIRALSDVTSGSRVRRGQWLASVFAPDTRAALQAYITALDVEDRDPGARRDAGLNVAAGSTASKSAQFTVERLRGLGMSDGQIEEMRRTRQIPLTLGVHAPADGFVLARNVSLGQKFEKGAVWFRIANLDEVWVLADVLEADAPFVKPGLAARVLLPGRREAVAATVGELLPEVDPATRSLKVRLAVANPGYALRPEMFVDVEVPVELPAATTVPAEAIVDSGARRVVFVERGDGWLEPRAIETGWRAGDRVEVVSGLRAGERIVVSGTFLVDSESRMKAAAAGVRGAPAKDPVCGMEVDEAKARAAGRAHAHGGRTFYFCSEQCQARFAAAPDRYAEKVAASEARR